MLRHGAKGLSLSKHNGNISPPKQLVITVSVNDSTFFVEPSEETIQEPATEAPKSEPNAIYSATQDMERIIVDATNEVQVHGAFFVVDVHSFIIHISITCVMHLESIAMIAIRIIQDSL